MDPNEEFSIGLDYYTGSIVRQSYEEAFGWFSKAAEHGDPNAEFFLGRMYAHGYGVKQSYPDAIRHLERAAEESIRKLTARL